MVLFSMLGVYTDVVIYPGIFLLCLLTLGLPRFLKRTVGWVIDTVLFARVQLGAVNTSVFTLVTGFTMVMVFVAYQSMQHAYVPKDTLALAHDRPALELKYAKSQRLFWISLFSCLLYIAIARIHYLHKKVDSLQEELDTANARGGGGATGGSGGKGRTVAPSAPEKPDEGKKDK